MSPEQQRIAIAEACGWTDISEPYSNEFVWTGIFRSLFREPIPDYLNDLNAMHEAEKLLVRHAQIGRYMWELERLTFWRPDYREGEDGKQYISPAAYYCTTHATAAQRAEALLRTLNLWTE